MIPCPANLPLRRERRFQLFWASWTRPRRSSAAAGVLGSTEFLDNPVVLPVKEIMDQLGNIRSQHAFASMDSGLDKGDNTKARRSVVVHESSTIGGRHTCRICPSGSMKPIPGGQHSRLHSQVPPGDPLVLPRVRIGRPKGACDVDGFMVCGQKSAR